MKKIISTALAGVFAATSMVATVTPAFADRDRDRVIENYYKKNARDDDYWRWKKNRSAWRERDYHNWARHRHQHLDGDDAAAALFGLAAGAIVGGAIANSNRPVVVQSGGDYYAYCSQRYRSFDPASGTYLGYDGLRHPCVMP